MDFGSGGGESKTRLSAVERIEVADDEVERQPERRSVPGSCVRADHELDIKLSLATNAVLLTEHRWQQYAGLRTLYGFMYAHPGKKLLFMGGEFGQWREWNHDASLDWHLLEDEAHAGIRRFMQALNWHYRHEPSLHDGDFDPSAFQWIDCHDHARTRRPRARQGEGRIRSGRSIWSTRLCSLQLRSRRRRSPPRNRATCKLRPRLTIFVAE